MKVILAEHAGACYGVKRALDMALEAARESSANGEAGEGGEGDAGGAADGERRRDGECGVTGEGDQAGPGGAAGEGGVVRTLGPLIHNPGVVRELEQVGVRVAESVEDVPRGGIAIIRSHGVTPDVHDELSKRGLKVIDATCPHVARAQKGAAELAAAGCRVIVVGEAGHPEVEGLKAYAKREGAKVDVVSSAEEVPDDLRAPIGVVVQTTQRRANLDAVVEAVKAQVPDPIVKNTICSATRLRQDAAADLAARVDAMVVVGGRNSSNTTRLAEICRAACPRTFHIESPDELDLPAFEACETVGVTAGASTPDTQIQAVLERLS